MLAQLVLQIWMDKLDGAAHLPGSLPPLSVSVELLILAQSEAGTRGRQETIKRE